MMRQSRWAMRALLTVTIAVTWSKAIEARNCPPNVIAAPHDNVVYLYYPTAQDPQFHSWGGGPATTPLGAFDLSQLDSSIGTEAALITRVETMVRTGLCEFDLGVVSARQAPSPGPSIPRWNIVGIGSDHAPTPPTPIAQAQHVSNTGDSDPQDYVRFWVADLTAWARQGGQLQIGIATLEQWATAMANVIVHEVGHNDGTGHADAAPRPNTNEDVSTNHFMSPLSPPTNTVFVNAYVNALKHHSDTSYEALAHSVGLAAQTVYNWDFVNPNATRADSFTITLLAMQPNVTLTEGWVYSGSLSPWSNALIVSGGQRHFQGQLRDEFQVIFYNTNINRTWSNGPPGEIPAGALFHTGLSVHGGAFAVYDAVLSYQGAPLPLHPRMVDFAGTTGFKLAGGVGPGFSIRLTNPNPARGPLLVSNVDVQFSPRMIDIETMVAGAVPRGLDDRPAALYTRPRMDLGREIQDRAALRRRQFVLGGNPITVPVAALSDPRHLMVEHGGCPPGAPPRPRRPWNDEVGECSRGTQLSLFPATYVYVTATVTDPLARYWDVRRRRMVRGPLATRVFFQVAGTVPDANRNGVDDLLDIRGGRSRDLNLDGVPDEAARDTQTRPGRP
ncbi:MAG TPA: hypothetical protein VJS15_10420 [Allosphingosinicella sp.]|nr:hypothetical protein [Allosphingosinicella sp.]